MPGCGGVSVQCPQRASARMNVRLMGIDHLARLAEASGDRRGRLAQPRLGARSASLAPSSQSLRNTGSSSADAREG